MHEPDFTAPDFPPLIELPLDPDWELGPAAQHTVLKYFRELLDQRAHVWANEDIEAVHKIRVAARRTRTALQTFADLWPADAQRKWLALLADFASAFDAARDLDVMIVYLREQMDDASPERRSAFEWLLARNVELRAEQQPKIEDTLARMERKKLAQRFVAYFATHPTNLWPPKVREPEPPPVDAASVAPEEASDGAR
jgi:CHAD domain-containing protein